MLLLADAVQSSRFLTERKSNALVKAIGKLSSKYLADDLRRNLHVEGRIRSQNESVFYNIDAIQRAISACLLYTSQARKAHGDKVILDDVTLSFYPGAKIGVVGPNGMGKSTLLKVMAGLEEVSAGDARLTPGYTVGILQQEPPLDEEATVIENIRMAFADVLAKVCLLYTSGKTRC